ncbi:MAG TPA: ABC transporter ATP-binding protein [Roseiarcus sp.]|nr:ABC transporter ATP-binding protein [Roseiarcus sp.]
MTDGTLGGPPIFRLSGLGFAYASGRSVLDGLDFELRPGERVALIGPNGSGKTTLLHLMLGLVRPQRGTVEAFGAARSTEAEFFEVRARAGLLFQDSDDQLFSPTVIEDVAFGPLNFGKSPKQARAIAMDTLSALGFADLAGRATHRLSGGQRRLVALATVLAMSPDALLLDEPSTGLDEPNVERLIAILDRLPQARIIISHDADFLARTTSRRCRLVAGRII